MKRNLSRIQVVFSEYPDVFKKGVLANEMLVLTVSKGKGHVKKDGMVLS